MIDIFLNVLLTKGKAIKNVIFILLMLLLFGVTGLFAQNNCLEFDGTDDYVGITIPAVFEDIPNNDFTIEFWAKLDDLASSQRMLEAYFKDGENPS